MWRSYEARVDGFLSHAVAREVAGYAILDSLCRRDVGIAASCVAPPKLCKSPPIEGARQLRVEPQRRTIIIDSRTRLAHLQTEQPARVISCGVVRLQLKRLVAVLQRCLQRSKHGAGPAASVPHGLQIGIETNCFVIVARRTI